MKVKELMAVSNDYNSFRVTFLNPKNTKEETELGEISPDKKITELFGELEITRIELGRDIFECPFLEIYIVGEPT